MVDRLSGPGCSGGMCALASRTVPEFWDKVTQVLCHGNRRPELLHETRGVGEAHCASAAVRRSVLRHPQGEVAGPLWERNYRNALIRPGCRSYLHGEMTDPSNPSHGGSVAARPITRAPIPGGVGYSKPQGSGKVSRSLVTELLILPTGSPCQPASRSSSSESSWSRFRRSRASWSP